MSKNRNLKDYEAHEKKKMSGISKIISTLIVLLLLGGLVFAVLLLWIIQTESMNV